MHNLTSLLASLFRPHAAAGFAVEPLDHPCLIGAGHEFLDDLPLPGFALARDGSVTLQDRA
jgi:hypothetical protein